MRANTLVKRETRADAGYEASRFALKVGMGISALIGFWGAACLIGGLASNGLGNMLRGFLTGVTGV